MKHLFILSMFMILALNMNAQTVCAETNPGTADAALATTVYPTQLVDLPNLPATTLNNGSGQSFDVSVTRGDFVGYKSTRYVLGRPNNDATKPDRKIQIINFSHNGNHTPADVPANGADEFEYTLDFTTVPANYSTYVRLSQTESKKVQVNANNEYSTYTISWSGGDPSQTAFYTDAPTDAAGGTTGGTVTMSTTLQPRYYPAGAHTGFDLANRQIEGTDNFGAVTNGGSFNVYHVGNSDARWFVDFPLGVTSVTVRKKAIVLTDGTGVPTDSDNTIAASAIPPPPASTTGPFPKAPSSSVLNDPTSGIGVSYPAYGADWYIGDPLVKNDAHKPGETYTEFICFQAGIAECTQTKLVPVELASFGARATEKGADVTWATYSELNHSHFMLERSFDGKTFEGIHREEGTGDSQVRKDYKYTDLDIPAPAGTKVYYRLQQVDYDGTTTYSDIAHIVLKGNKDIKIAPNPVTNGSFTVYAKDIKTVEVYNTFGQRVLYQATDKSDEVQIGTDRLPAGMYIIRVNNNTSQKVMLK